MRWRQGPGWSSPRDGQRPSRLAVRWDTGGNASYDRLRRRLFAWGDLAMMRKQLLTLKVLAGRHASA